MSVQVNHRRDSNAVIETVTPAVAELGFDTTKKEALIGDGATLGGIRIQKKNARDILVAAQIVANTNNYSPSGLAHAGSLIISTDASRNITGLVPLGVTDTLDGREITIYNAGSFNAVLQDQNAASTAANRFDLGGADITMAPKQSIMLRYRTQGALNRWEVRGGSYGQAISDGAVSARKLATSSLGAFAGLVNGTLAPSVAASALTIALKTLAGADPSPTDPVFAVFRDVTATAGDFVVLTVTAATSLVISSGSSMGVAANNTAFRLWVVGFNDAGTFRLGAINALNGTDVFPLSAWGIDSSTAEGGAGAADNAQTFYTGTAVSAKAYATLGYLSWESGLAATGTWSAAPTRAQLAGYGVALPGSVVNRARAVTSGGANGSITVPYDDTIPQITEGNQFLTKAITPTSGANLLKVKSRLMLSGIAGTQRVASSIFRDATANALATNYAFVGNAGEFCQTVETVTLAGAVTATTFRVRAGSDQAGTVYLNGSGAARFYGGALDSALDIEEIMA